MPASSERMNASAIMRRASSGEEGSKTGTLAKCAKRRESCSVWEEWGPGSSQEMMTIPPTMPV